MKSALFANRQTLARKLSTGLAVVLASVGAAHATDAPNAGIDAVNTAIAGLGTGIGTIVVTAIGIGLIVVGAKVALRVGKSMLS